MPENISLRELQEKVALLEAKNDELESRNQHFRQLTEKLNDVLYTLDPDARITYISPNVERIAGYSPEELIGRNYRELIAPDDQENPGETFQRVLAGEELVNEHQYFTKNRGPVWALNRAAPLYEKNRIAGVQGVLVDISESKKARELVQEGEERYRRIIENAGDIVFSVNGQGEFIYISPNCETILGYRDHEFIGASFEQFVHPDDVGRIYNAMSAVFDEYRRSSRMQVDQKIVDYRALSKDGRWIWLSAKNTILTEANGGFELACIARDVTDRKRAEEALRKSEEKYRELVLNARDVFYSLDLQGNFLEVNEAFLNEGGWCKGEIIGLNLENLIDPHDRPAAREALESIKNGQVMRLEMRVRRKDNSYGWYSLVNRPLYDKNAQITRITGIARNIDRTKSIEQALRESEQQKNLILNATSEMIAYYDTDLRIIWANQAAAESVGSQPENLVGRHCYEVWQQRSDPCPNCPLLKTGVTRRPEQLEQQTSDGRQWLIRGYPVIDDKDNVTAFVEFGQEVTNYRDAEAALRESEERFSIAFKSSPAPLVISEIDTGLFFDVNDRWLEMLGYPREEMIGRTSKDVGIWDEPAERDRIVQKLRTDGRFRDEPIVFRTKSGGIIQALWSAEAINISGQEVMLSMITDITELKRAEEERERLQEQLSHAQKMESIGRLAGGVAHDLNNLLSPILGYGEMLLEDATPNDPRKGSICEIVSAGKRAQALVRQLLAFSRKQPLQFQPININELLSDFKKLLRRTLREDIKIQTNLAGSLPQVKGDIGQLEQVIMNIAVNAQDAMPRGGALLVETDHVDLDQRASRGEAGVEPGPYIMVAISDTGCGMDAETLKNIFEPFFTTKEIGRGTGLGMSTAYGIIKQHGGDIRVYSESGQGTTIRIYLPVPEEAGDMLQTRTSKPSANQGFETILLAEDNHDVRTLGATVLERYGYKVLTAANGQEALAVLQNHGDAVHLLLTDVIMPDIDGKELFSRVSENYPGIRVLYMSGYTDDVIGHQGVIDTRVSFIEKPFSINALASKVREVLDK